MYLAYANDSPMQDDLDVDNSKQSPFRGGGGGMGGGAAFLHCLDSVKAAEQRRQRHGAAHVF